MKAQREKRFHKFEAQLGRIFLVLISIYIVFMACEYVARIYFANRPDGVYLSLQGYMPRPFVVYGTTRNDPRVNELGYLGPLPGPKAPNEFRVFILGGSTLFYGNPPLPEIIQNKFFSDGYNNVKIFNLGVASSNVQQDLVRILMDVFHHSPDLIVMYGGGNELLHPDPRPGYPHGFLLFENNPLWEKDPWKYKFFPLMAYGSQLLRYLFAPWFMEQFIQVPNMPKHDVRSKEWSEEVAHIYLNSLYKASLLSKNLKAKYLFYFQPMSYFKEPLTSVEESFTQNTPYYLAMREFILKEAPRFKEHYKLIDISDILDNYPDQAFYDSIHLLDPANHFIAGKIYPDLLKVYLSTKHGKKSP